MKYVYPHVQWNWLDSGVCVVRRFVRIPKCHCQINIITVWHCFIVAWVIHIDACTHTIHTIKIVNCHLPMLPMVCHSTPFRSISFPSTYTILIPESQGSEWNVLSLRDARTRFAFPPRNIQSRRQKTMFSFSVWKLNFNDNAIKFCNCASSIYFNDFRLIFKHTASSVCRFARFSTFWSCRI